MMFLQQGNTKKTNDGGRIEEELEERVGREKKGRSRG
jgi:hypothetical protein